MSSIVKKDVEHIAGLARIKLTEKEKEKMVDDLGAVLGYIDKLKEVDTNGIEPIAHITGLENILRMDEPLPNHSLESPKLQAGKEKPLDEQAANAARLVEMALEKKDNFVKVKAVFGE